MQFGLGSVAGDLDRRRSDGKECITHILISLQLLISLVASTCEHFDMAENEWPTSNWTEGTGSNCVLPGTGIIQASLNPGNYCTAFYSSLSIPSDTACEITMEINEAYSDGYTSGMGIFFGTDLDFHGGGAINMYLGPHERILLYDMTIGDYIEEISDGGPEGFNASEHRDGYFNLTVRFEPDTGAVFLSTSLLQSATRYEINFGSVVSVAIPEYYTYFYLSGPVEMASFCVAIECKLPRVLLVCVAW